MFPLIKKRRIGGDLESSQADFPQVARYRLTFRAPGGGRFGAYAGSAWRGALGHALKRVVCVTSQPACEPCLLYRSCAYPYIFETPPPPGAAKMRLYKAAPHPFVIEPADYGPRELEPGATTSIRLVLVGRAITQLPYMVLALRRAGEQGLGPRRSRLDLLTVEQEATLGAEDWREIYGQGEVLDPLPAAASACPAPPNNGEVEVRLCTPLRLRRDGANLTADDFNFRPWFSALLRRVSMLSYFHGAQALETDFRGLVAAAGRVPLAEPQLRWREWTRYSSRQRTTLQMGGLVGSFRLAAGDLQAFWPYLWFGQWVHAGRGASMGLGRYLLCPARLPDALGNAGDATVDGEDEAIRPHRPGMASGFQEH